MINLILIVFIIVTSCTKPESLEDQFKRLSIDKMLQKKIESIKVGTLVSANEIREVHYLPTENSNLFYAGDSIYHISEIREKDYSENKQDFDLVMNTSTKIWDIIDENGNIIIPYKATSTGGDIRTDKIESAAVNWERNRFTQKSTGIIFSHDPSNPYAYNLKFTGKSRIP